ncbi:hypothetical protein MHO82_18615 [Vibrio sp. Of7-15]|uniref:hypothetical protein n=1 Tax=Vibrio sp. Of7-15 TaxID=2724879 RepID=UPI001EF38A49|nr:hypothetical protein [Vibrio sp. Of7-15]MCG7498881.1 hypothetical protein [Vibrio sp. Of7-15]
MAKSLCKYNRHSIASNMGTIHQIISSPKYVCSSCARSASGSEYLCKPSPLPPAACVAKVTALSRDEGVAIAADPKKDTGCAVLDQVINRDKKKSESKEKKRIKKALKRQKKYKKKLEKMIKKQKKMLKKQDQLTKKSQLLDKRVELTKDKIEQQPALMH